MAQFDKLSSFMGEESEQKGVSHIDNMGEVLLT